VTAAAASPRLRRGRLIGRFARAVQWVLAMGSFALDVVREFRRNQGFLLAGAVAYYTLLSLIPLLILVLIALSGLIDPERVLATLAEYLEFIVPGQADPLVAQLRIFLAHRDAVGGVLVATMLVFSALAFTVLESALSVIFFHRAATRHRHVIVSALMPYVFIVFLGLGLLVVTVIAGKLAVLGTRNIVMFGDPTSLNGLSAYLLYLIGVAGEIFILTAIYVVMPVGRLTFRHALIGGASAGILWELTRHVLVWYYGTISQVQLVYGPLATAVTVLLSVEIGAVLLLLGAQVIAQYERRIGMPMTQPVSGGWSPLSERRTPGRPSSATR
jgi:membrane protein